MIAGPATRVGLALAVVFLAGSATAHDDHDPRADLMVAVIASVGCTMDDEMADSILPQYGFTKSESREIAAMLLSDGRARIDQAKGALVLAPEECY